MMDPFFIFARRTGPQPGANAIAWTIQRAPMQSPIGQGVVAGEYAAFQAPEVFWPAGSVPGGFVTPFYIPPAGLGGVMAAQVYYSGAPFDPNAMPSAQTQGILQPFNPNFAPPLGPSPQQPNG